METPILFIIYNRPEYTQKVFNSIRTSKPRKLFVSADGPKKDDKVDFFLCETTRKIVNDVDWPCEVYNNFSNENMGCKLGVTRAINWFFENVEEGIILEDDCLPTHSFFGYCEKLLMKYRDNKKIMMISGSNPAIVVDNIDSDYFFSRFYHVWGWATWKRSWIKMDINLTNWPKYRQEKLLDKYYKHNKINQLFSERMFDNVYNKKSSVWGIQWAYSCLVNDGLAILPKNNLISNIGFLGDHAMNIEQLVLKVKDINYNNLIPPKKINIQSSIENILFDKSGLKNLII